MLALMVLGQYNDCPSTNEVIVKSMSKIEEQTAVIQDKIPSLYTIPGMYWTNPDATECTGVTTSEKHLLIHRKRLQAAGVDC